MIRVRMMKSVIASVIVVTSVVWPGFAWAADGGDAPPSSVLDVVEAATPDTVADAAQGASTEADGSLSYSLVDGEVNIPHDPSDGVSLRSGGTTLEIALPSAAHADDAVHVSSGVVQYDNNNDSLTVPIVQRDGSVQINTVIQSPQAPSEYSYDIAVPGGGRLSLDASSGLVSIFDAGGGWVGGVNPAWAKDAAGKSVPTWYTVDGSTLTQHVDLTTSNLEFPVVADPWAGKWLVDHVWWGRRASWAPGNTLMVYPTGWGRYWVQQYVWPAQWGDVLAKTPAAYRNIVNRSNMLNQFVCHLQLGASLWKDSYNLDSWIYRSSLASYLAHGCN